MKFASFLSFEDRERACKTLVRLRSHGIAPLVLSGGIAVELHCLRHGHFSKFRTLNDIDFLAGSFDQIPKTLGADFLVRHVHPENAAAGKMLLQLVDRETSVCVDIFHSLGHTTARAIPVELEEAPICIIPLEDLVARTARLCMDLAANMPTPAKYARNFLRLLPLLHVDQVERVWPEHRKTHHPESFKITADLLRLLIAAREDLLILPAYSHDLSFVCPRCKPTADLPLADPARVMELLGYC